MTKQSSAPGERARAWNKVANVALIIGAVVTAYLVYLAFSTV